MQIFATCLEEALSQIRLQFLYLVYESGVEHHLCDDLFYGMVNTLLDIIHNLYDDTNISYAQVWKWSHRLKLKCWIIGECHPPVKHVLLVLALVEKSKPLLLNR